MTTLDVPVERARLARGVLASKHQGTYVDAVNSNGDPVYCYCILGWVGKACGLSDEDMEYRTTLTRALGWLPVIARMNPGTAKVREVVERMQATGVHESGFTVVNDRLAGPAREHELRILGGRCGINFIFS